MKKIKQHIIDGKSSMILWKKVVMGVMICMMFSGILGCGHVDREKRLEKELRSDKEYATYYYDQVTNALETKDMEKLKTLFSPYALDKTSDIDEQITELMEFYPGYTDDYEVSIRTSESSSYSGKKYAINAQYLFSVDGADYRMMITAYTQNVVEIDKVGIHMIQIFKEDAVPNGFKWKDEDDVPGIYVFE